MLAQGAKPVIIIKRNKKGHGGHHGGAWKVAYADFVTAMMALFIVLWLLSSSEQVQKAVGGYFSDPQGKGKDVGNGLKGAGSESLSVKKDDMNQLKEKLAQAIKSTAAFQKIKEHVIFTITAEGLRVELVEGEHDTFFEKGSPHPTDFGKDLLRALAEEIGKLPNRVTMEGHTDSRPYRGPGDYTNWELSADRANAARRWMQDNGMRIDQVTQVRGFADQSLRDPAHPDNGSNRRVTLIIQYQSGPAASSPPPSEPSPAPKTNASPGIATPALKANAPSGNAAPAPKTNAPPGNAAPASKTNPPPGNAAPASKTNPPPGNAVPVAKTNAPPGNAAPAPKTNAPPAAAKHP